MKTSKCVSHDNFLKMQTSQGFLLNEDHKDVSVQCLASYNYQVELIASKHNGTDQAQSPQTLRVHFTDYYIYIQVSFASVPGTETYRQQCVQSLALYTTDCAE